MIFFWLWKLKKNNQQNFKYFQYFCTKHWLWVHVTCTCCWGLFVLTQLFSQETDEVRVFTGRRWGLWRQTTEIPRKKQVPIFTASENQHFAYAKTKAQISFAVTAKLISAFVSATWIIQFLYFLNLQFPATSYLLCLYSLVCVRPVRKPHCWFLHDMAHMAL